MTDRLSIRLPLYMGRTDQHHESGQVVFISHDGLRRALLKRLAASCPAGLDSVSKGGEAPGTPRQDHLRSDPGGGVSLYLGPSLACQFFFSCKRAISKLFSFGKSESRNFYRTPTASDTQQVFMEMPEFPACIQEFDDLRKKMDEAVVAEWFRKGESEVKRNIERRVFE